MKAFHECELKLKINDSEMENKIVSKIEYEGYVKSEQSIETDYIMETERMDFDKQLFRVRSYLSEEKEDLIFTIKIKGGAGTFQDNMEYEICASRCEMGDAKTMKNLIKELTGIAVSERVFSERNVIEVLEILRKAGFYIKRVIQKKRNEYVCEKAKIMFDVFPEPVGTYLEIEAGSEEDLKNEVKRIGVENLSLEKRNYGQIIREATNGKNRLTFD